MEPSQACFNLVKHFEGLRLSAYTDLAGKKTIGYGHTGEGLPDTCTTDQAAQWLKDDLWDAGSFVTSLVKANLNQNEFDALTSFVYNVGWKHFAASALLHLINLADFEKAAEQFSLWDHVNGQVEAGLLRRRVAEQQLFLTPVAPPAGAEA